MQHGLEICFERNGKIDLYISLRQRQLLDTMAMTYSGLYACVCMCARASIYIYIYIWEICWGTYSLYQLKKYTIAEIHHELDSENC